MTEVMPAMAPAQTLLKGLCCLGSEGILRTWCVCVCVCVCGEGECKSICINLSTALSFVETAFVNTIHFHTTSVIAMKELEESGGMLGEGGGGVREGGGEWEARGRGGHKLPS